MTSFRECFVVVARFLFLSRIDGWMDLNLFLSFFVFKMSLVIDVVVAVLYYLNCLLPLLHCAASNTNESIRFLSRGRETQREREHLLLTELYRGPLFAPTESHPGRPLFSLCVPENDEKIL